MFISRCIVGSHKSPSLLPERENLHRYESHVHDYSSLNELLGDGQVRQHHSHQTRTGNLIGHRSTLSEHSLNRSDLAALPLSPRVVGFTLILCTEVAAGTLSPEVHFEINKSKHTVDLTLSSVTAGHA